MRRICVGVCNAWAAFGLLLNWFGSEEAGALGVLHGVGGKMRDLRVGFGCTLSCIRRGPNSIFGIWEALVTFSLHEGAASEDNNIALRYC